MTEKELPRALLSPAQTKKYNSKIVQLMSILLNVAPAFADIEIIKELSRESGVSLEYAYAEMIAAMFGLDTIGADRAFFRNYFLPMVNELRTEDYTEDDYYKNIVISHGKSGKWELECKELKAGEAFVCRDFLVTDDGRMIPQIGFFTTPFRYPSVLENGREWMTLMPNETVTTLPAVERARGKVLTYGLGLGYFAYMASCKPEVTSVTVVDISPDVITLFREHILPQFPFKDKINIVMSDAFEYAENVMPSEKYDYVFADIWHDVGDGRDIYLRMKECEKNCPGTVFDYWLEDTIKCYLDKDLWE